MSVGTENIIFDYDFPASSPGTITIALLGFTTTIVPVAGTTTTVELEGTMTTFSDTGAAASRIGVVPLVVDVSISVVAVSVVGMRGSVAIVTDPVVGTSISFAVLSAGMVVSLIDVILVPASLLADSLVAVALEAASLAGAAASTVAVSLVGAAVSSARNSVKALTIRLIPSSNGAFAVVKVTRNQPYSSSLYDDPGAICTPCLAHASVIWSSRAACLSESGKAIFKEV